MSFFETVWDTEQPILGRRKWFQTSYISQLLRPLFIWKHWKFQKCFYTLALIIRVDAFSGLPIFTGACSCKLCVLGLVLPLVKSDSNSRHMSRVSKANRMHLTTICTVTTFVNEIFHFLIFNIFAKEIPNFFILSLWGIVCKLVGKNVVLLI